MANPPWATAANDTKPRWEVTATASLEQLLGSGLYPVTDAARVLHARPQTVHRWLQGYTYRRAEEVRARPGLLEPALPKRDHYLTVSFLELVELLFVKAYRDKRVPLQKIRIAADWARREFNTAYPFASADFKTSGKSLFVQLETELGHWGLVEPVSAANAQWALPEVVEHYLSDIEFDEDLRRAIRYFPRGKDGGVVLDPRVSFGQPVLVGTGVPTAVIQEQLQAGDTPELVADWYGLSRQQVDAAATFESELAA